MFELNRPPSRLDAESNTVIAGSDRVRLFPGAQLALRELTTQERFSDTKVAVASSTTKREWALTCLRLLQVHMREKDACRSFCLCVGVGGGGGVRVDNTPCLHETPPIRANLACLMIRFCRMPQEYVICLYYE